VQSDCSQCTSGQSTDPTDAIAVQRFKADGVEVVFPFNYSPNFFNQARAQNYHPQWMLYGNVMVTSNNPQVPADQLDGALGLTFEQVSEQHSGIPASDEQKKCLKYFTDAGNKPVDVYSSSGVVLRNACDSLNVFVSGLTGAGPTLTLSTLVAGMETISDLRLSYYGRHTFARGKHWGATQNVAQRYHQDCACFKVVGPWVPLYTQP
jgi:hypothetical protein